MFDWLSVSITCRDANLKRSSNNYYNNIYFSILQTMGYMKRGDEAQLKAVFDKYASANIDGVGMSYEELTLFFANFAFTGLLRRI